MTRRQMEIADCLDEMGLYSTVEINGHRVTRDDQDVYMVDGERLCFVQAYDRLTS